MAEALTIDSISQLLDARKGTWFAVASQKLIPSTSIPSGPDQAASKAAEAWVKNPTPANQSAAEEAAKAAKHGGPGAWAAQAAAWAKTKSPMPGAPNLSAHAVAGSVKLSAALKAGAKLPEAPTAPTVPAKPTLPDLKMPSIPGKPNMPSLSAPTMPAKPTLPTLKAPAIPSKPTVPSLNATSAPSAPAAPATPVDQATVDAAHQPFIELGKQILNGKNLWA